MRGHAKKKKPQRLPKFKAHHLFLVPNLWPLEALPKRRLAQLLLQQIPPGVQLSYSRKTKPPAEALCVEVQIKQAHIFMLMHMYRHVN